MLGRDGEDEEVIWVKREPEYFCKGDWTGQITLMRHDKSDFGRRSMTLMLAEACYDLAG
jgi:hypothetical protein